MAEKVKVGYLDRRCGEEESHGPASNCLKSCHVEAAEGLFSLIFIYLGCTRLWPHRVSSYWCHTGSSSLARD